MRKAGWLLALLAMMATAAPAAGQRPAPLSPAEVASLQAQMQQFLHAVRSMRSDSVAAFFPRQGDFTRVYTEHREGRDRVSVWRFPAADLPRAIGYGGPLRASFSINVEGQPIGLFFHQLMTRGAARQEAWRRVRGTRFVLAGEPADAPLFVEWRREGSEWVIAAYGDEWFRGGKLPAWCC
jgi:hypothetical protein